MRQEKGRQRTKSSSYHHQGLKGSSSPGVNHQGSLVVSQQVTSQGFNSDQIVSKFETKFGPTGSRWLSVIGALLGVSRTKIKNIQVLCDGERLKGYYTIDQLMADGHLADRGVNSNQGNRHLFYISHIAAALPHSPFMFLESLDEDDETVHRLIGYDIRTSLPRSLRYFHAANLPLGPRTRKAHLLWSINFAKMIKSTFDGSIYQRRARNAEKYGHVPNLITLLNQVESTIELTQQEMQVQYPLTHHR